MTSKVRNLGVLGGGQLARMLVEAGARLGLRPRVLATAADDPAAQVCPDAFYGALSDRLALERFMRETSGLCVLENEFLPTDLVSQASEVAGCSVQPSLDVVAALQDKHEQKRIFDRLGIRTSPFCEIRAQGGKAAPTQNSPWFDQGTFVVKWARMGYDGKGTWISGVSREDLKDFIGRAVEKKVPLFAEQKVAFQRELAAVFVSGVDGSFASYPVVETRQERGICRWVRGPAQGLGLLSAEGEAELVSWGRKLAAELGLTGVFALECFLDEKGALWANELAPRVHNSGHYTQNAAQVSQFENHWRAVLGWPLGDTTTAPAFVMWNLLGSGVNPPAWPIPIPSEMSLHWYGKDDWRAGRKLGHVNRVFWEKRESHELLAWTERAIAECRDWDPFFQREGS